MADIRDMFANMNNDKDKNDKSEPAPPPPPKPAANKKKTIEKTYQKKTQLEHILLRPDTYIGSVEHTEEIMWIYDSESDAMLQKQISFVPGLYKIFDEVLVNAADNKQRDKKMDCIKIEINQETNVISVWNNGQGIDVAMHKEEKMYVPTMIFGHLLTSSNFDDEEEKVTGGRNGYGAKLCNIFSTKFCVETASKEYKKHFKQTWGSNMTKVSEAKIKDFSGEEFTKITFSPDLAKFKMDKLDNDIIGLLSRRAFDVAASTRGVKVFLNGKKLPVKNFKDYIDLYLKNREDAAGNPVKVIYENVNERWEVALTVSEHGFKQISFVNSIATTKGGKHVDYVVDMITKHLVETLNKKNKGGINIRPFQVKNHMWIFINCLIVNPSFDSQTKEHMTLQVKNFGSKCQLSDKFFTAVTKSSLIESVLKWAQAKAQVELSKTSGKKNVKLKGIPKLEDANEAGRKDAAKCTLILTEGDSAKSSVVSGLGVIGRDHYGVFPLRGKLLNVREATHKQILENAEIKNLIKILGLQYDRKYATETDMKTLRYGKVMIMTDQDQDGSHIKGLLINFIHHNWPELLRQNFLEEFITPIVKASKRNEVLTFYSIPEFEEWKGTTPNYNTYTIKYYKGLGTSGSNEMREYFSNMARHRIRFRYNGPQDDENILLAFSKKLADNRKIWLTNFMTDTKRRKEIGLPERYLYTKDTRVVTYSDFINLELVLFSNADNVRSIPCLVDGVKPGQRKVLFTCFKRNDKREVKVAQLSGFVAALSAYHHGEVSLCATIVNLAQNFVGSNNINLLEPIGQFGTRLCGGKDSASARYIFTKLSPMARLIFHSDDDPLLKHEYDDNKKIEPVWYIPILPMILVNGADGIGTGWMTKIPNYNPRQIVQNLRNMLDGEEPTPMIPWYKNFTGTVDDCGDQRYLTSGEVSIVGPNKIEITELPIGTWTQNYKENVLEPLLHGSEKVKPIISDYKEYNTDTTVKFVVTLQPGQMEAAEQQGLHKVFKLQSIMSTTSMCLFDELGCLRRYDSVMEMLQEFYTLRMKMYKKRKDYLEGLLEAEASKLSNQARFIMEKCSGEFVVENKKRKTIIDELVKRQYAPDPVIEWKRRLQMEEEEEEAEESPDDSTESTAENFERDFKKLSDVKKYDYLLGMSMWMLTEERKNELLRQRDVKLDELETMRRLTPEDIWRKDLNNFSEKLTLVEEKERAEELGATQKNKKGATAKKKINLQETMPSPGGRRIVPILGDDLKKRIQNAIKSKENKGKRGVKKEILAEDDKDEFDMMVDNKKTLKDKLGTPEEAEKKAKGKKQKDGFKQTKLNFKSKSDEKVNGSPKKRGRKKKVSDSEDEDDISISGSDVEFGGEVSMVKERTTSRRVTKSIKYSVDSSESDDRELELSQNNIIKEDNVQVAMEASSESENEVVPKKAENSDDLFDSLIGKKSDTPPKELDDHPSKKRHVVLSSDSEEVNVDIEIQPLSKKTETKKRVVSSSDSDKETIISNSDSDSKKPSKHTKKKAKIVNAGPPQKKVTKSKPKKKANVSDDESDIGVAKKKRAKKKKKTSSDESDFEFNKNDISSESDSPIKPTTKAPPPRSGRAVKQIKYNFDSDESD
ncbi:hypothetical protein RI129_011253 [Pyrocoelia pectoralis]|uniref:DNA topoisomerase 2 n=1 Tax=Pyrocoelia pectoralis TaxID=417401 RepID=A0AAN7ZEF1_9COLE